MATWVFADEELARSRAFPEISREELYRFFKLTPSALAFIAPGRGCGPADRLGMAVALYIFKDASKAGNPSNWAHRCGVSVCASRSRCSVRVCAGGRTNPNHGSVRDELAERGKSGEDRQALLDELVHIPGMILSARDDSSIY